MTCIRSCSLKDQHLTECSASDCWGCLPRPSEEGLLCPRCYRRLSILLGPADDPESLAGAVRWLESNQGQFLRSSTGGGGSNSSGATYGDHMVAAMSHIADITHSLHELATDFGASAEALHLYLSRLADWEPIGDHLDHLDALLETAHSISPWREKRNQSIHTAALLFLLPPEPAADIARRFEVPESWVRRQKQVGNLCVDTSTTPHRFRPWDVFKLICPDAAEKMEVDLIHYKGPLAFTTAA